MSKVFCKYENGPKVKSIMNVWKYFESLARTFKNCGTPASSAASSAAEIDKIGWACSGSAEPDRPARDCLSPRPHSHPSPHPQPQKVRQAQDSSSFPSSSILRQVDKIVGHALAEPDRQHRIAYLLLHQAPHPICLCHSQI